MKNKNNLIIVAVALIAVAGLVIAMQSGKANVNDFESCADAGYPVMESYPAQCRGPDGTLYIQDIPAGNNTNVSAGLASYFAESLRSRGVENLGAMPIEGFDPDLYMGAFPGLEKSDFHNVAAIGGVWTYNSATDELEFGPTPRYHVTSADGTINEEGMPTLLNNIATRLGVTVTDNSSVDSLIDRISEE